MKLETRLKRAEDHKGRIQQPRRGNCLICGNDWMTCPHTRSEVEDVIAEYQRRKLVRKHFS